MVRELGAVELNRYSLEISQNRGLSTYKAEFKKVDGSAYMLRNVEGTSLDANHRVIVMGCPKCNNNKGLVKVWNAKTIAELAEVQGGDKYEDLGSDVRVMQNTGST